MRGTSFSGGGYPTIGRKPKKLPKAPNIAPEDAINADGDEFIFDSTDRQMLDPKKFRPTKRKPKPVVDEGLSIFPRPAEVGKGRRKGAAKARAQGSSRPPKATGTEWKGPVKNIVDMYRPIKSRDAKTEISEEDVILGAAWDYLRNHTRAVRSLANRTKEEKMERYKDWFQKIAERDGKSVDEIIASYAELEETESVIKPKTEIVLKEIIGLTAEESPAFRKIFDDMPFPRISLFNRISEETLDLWETKDLPRLDPRKNKIAGFTNSGMIHLNARWLAGFFNSSGTEMKNVDGEDITDEDHNFGANPMAVLRHETGHVFEEYVVAFGNNDQIDAYNQIVKYFNEEVPKAKEQQKQIAALERSLDPADREAALKLAADLIRSGEYVSNWWTNYAETNKQEFFAELFRMATSPNEDIRNSIPPNLWITLTKLFGFDPRGM
jgi:hypothetical protein